MRLIPPGPSERHPKALGDLGRGHAQPPQQLDDLDAIGRGAVGDRMRRLSWIS
jgi:hypothetical protein